MYKLRDVTQMRFHSNLFISGTRKIVFMLFFSLQTLFPESS